MFTHSNVKQIIFSGWSLQKYEFLFIFTQTVFFIVKFLSQPQIIVHICPMFYRNGRVSNTFVSYNIEEQDVPLSLLTTGENRSCIALSVPELLRKHSWPLYF